MDLRLGLDTATPYLALCLWSPRDGTLVARAPRVERDHASRLVPELDVLLHEAGRAPDALSAVTVGVGPGSYTGLRVGIAAARALGSALGIPVAGSSTLAQIAWGALREGETGVAVLDARRGNVYAAVYRREADGLTSLSPAEKAERERVRTAWPEARWLEDLPPDASWAARGPVPGPEPEAVYL